MPERVPLTDFERLHLAVTRLFVLVLYRPILRPTLRWLSRNLPADKEN